MALFKKNSKIVTMLYMFVNDDISIMKLKGWLKE